MFNFSETTKDILQNIPKDEKNSPITCIINKQEHHIYLLPDGYLPYNPYLDKLKVDVKDWESTLKKRWDENRLKEVSTSKGIIFQNDSENQEMIVKKPYKIKYFEEGKIKEFETNIPPILDDDNNMIWFRLNEDNFEENKNNDKEIYNKIFNHSYILHSSNTTV